MRRGAGLLTLAFIVCFPGVQSPEKCRSIKALVAAAQASGGAQADEVGWYGPPGTLVRISAPEEPFLPVTFPKPAPPAASTAPAVVEAPPLRVLPHGGLGRALSAPTPFSPYFTRAAGPALRSPLDAERHLSDWGFTQITDMELRGGSYLCEATGPRRERVRLVLDAHSGEISGMEVIGFEDKRY